MILSNTVMTAVLSGAFSFVNLVLLFYYESSLAWIGIGLALLAMAFMTTIGWLKLKYDRQISDVQGTLQGFFEFYQDFENKNYRWRKKGIHIMGR